MKKFLAILLLTFLLVMAGCENVTYETSSQEESVVSDIYEELNSQLPDVEGKIEKQDFVIITDKIGAFYNEETEPTPMGKTIEDRNAFLEDKYGAKVIVRSPEGEVAEELKNASLSGTKYCDMMALSVAETTRLYDSGLLLDINTLPDFSLDNGYFDSTMAKTMATNQSLYILADPTALVYDKANVLFYNKDTIVLPEEGGLDPQVLVMQGKWTWDKFDEYQKLAAAEVYRKWGGDIETDLFGFGAYNYKTCPVVMWNSCNLQTVGNTYKTNLSITMDIELMVDMTEQLRGYYNLVGKYPLDSDDARLAFEEGRLAFFQNELDYIYGLRDGSALGNNFGILPMPKYNEEQEGYKCMLGSDARVLSVPTTVAEESDERKLFVSHVISATCAVGNKTIKEAYVNSLLALYLNNNEELLMAETICDSVCFDFLYSYGSGIDKLSGGIYEGIGDHMNDGLSMTSAVWRGINNFDEYCGEHFNIPEESE